MKEPSLQHGMSAEFEITNKSQKELQHGISLLASMLVSRELQNVAKVYDDETATLLSSVVGITRKRVAETVLEIESKKSKEFVPVKYSPTPSPSPRRTESPPSRSLVAKGTPESNMGDLDDSPPSIESFGNRKIRLGKEEPGLGDDGSRIIIRNLKSVHSNHKSPSLLGSQAELPGLNSPKVGAGTRKDQTSGGPSHQRQPSRSKEKSPVPIKGSAILKTKPTGDLETPL